MADSLPEFEIVDSLGTTTSFSGTAGTGLTSVPASPATVIQEYSVICDPGQSLNQYLIVYVDGGTVEVARLYSGGSMHDIVKSGLQQIQIKTSASTLTYKVVLHREVV